MVDATVRAATPDDAAPLAAVYRAAYAENAALGFPTKAAEATAADVASWVRDHRVFVADGPDGVVGGVRVEHTDPDRGKVSRLAVHPAAQGDGLGTGLLERAERAVRESGRPTVWLTAPGAHPDLPAYYRSQGYDVTGPYPLAYREYDEVVFEKTLR